MDKITFVLPSRNNLEFLQLAYKSIRNLRTRHEILILDDASTDGTQDWIVSLNDPDLLTHHNPGPERIGIVGMFDTGIKLARTEIIFAFHADMVAGPSLDENILKHLKPGTVVSATRIEPPLHPEGPEKITQPWGNEIDEFDFNASMNGMGYYERTNKDKTTEGIFAPWCMYKKDFLAIGGHDTLFAPQSKEDSDLFNRFHLNGYKLIQSWDAVVYHFTSRGSRFNKHAGGGAGKNSDEWLYTTTKNGRNFIRKWGHFVKHDSFMKPIVSPKYNIAYVVKNCNSMLLETLEPWCDRLYVDDHYGTMITNYIESEQPNTKLDLTTRVLNTNLNDPYNENDIVVEFDASQLNNHNFAILQQLPDILYNQGEPGEFTIEIFKLSITSLTEYQNDLIKLS